jgi:hypothetical protein
VPFCKPFPVVAFAHGYGSSRSEFTLHIGRHTAMGFAACAIDSYGHGFNRGIVDPVNAGALLLSIPRFQKYVTKGYVSQALCRRFNSQRQENSFYRIQRSSFWFKALS